MRRVYLVRHGETEGESSIRFHGRNDVRLNEAGRRQIRGLARWLPAGPVPVVHSPLLRARESAAILVASRGWEAARVEEDPGLTEIFFGHCEGLTAEEIRERMPEFHATWRAGRAEGFPGGETYATFAERITAALESVFRRHPGDLMIVAHRGVVRWGMRMLLGIPAGEKDDYTVDLGSLTILAGRERYEVQEFNLVAEKTP